MAKKRSSMPTIDIVTDSKEEEKWLAANLVRIEENEKGFVLFFKTGVSKAFRKTTIKLADILK